MINQERSSSKRERLHTSQHEDNQSYKKPHTASNIELFSCTLSQPKQSVEAGIHQGTRQSGADLLGAKHLMHF